MTNHGRTKPAMFRPDSNVSFLFWCYTHAGGWLCPSRSAADALYHTVSAVVFKSTSKLIRQALHSGRTSKGSDMQALAMENAMMIQRDIVRPAPQGRNSAGQ